MYKPVHEHCEPILNAGLCRMRVLNRLLVLDGQLPVGVNPVAQFLARLEMRYELPG